MPQDGVDPECSNLKKCFEILVIAHWNLPMALPSTGQCGTAHVLHPPCQGVALV